MQKFETRDSRSVLPRLRPLENTPVPELLSTRLKITRDDHDDAVYSNSLAKWEESRSLNDAVEVLNGAALFGVNPQAQKAINQILESDSEAVEPVKSLAKRMASGSNATQSVEFSNFKNSNAVTANSEIRRLKERLRDYPRDALSCIDLARLQAGIGQAKNASRYVERAVIQCPNNRYIVRSAARFFVHIGEPDRALAMLHKGIDHRDDPWIQAAEISVRDILEKPPSWRGKEIKNANLRNGLNVHHSELVAGLAALELKDGSLKSARKLFGQSMKAPTDNSLAQFRWAQSKGVVFHNIIPTNISKVSRSYEAKLYEALENENGMEAAEQAENWLRDEPYSSEPAMLGSSICAGVLDDPVRTIEFSELGLKVAPNQQYLWNNKLVALARMGRIKDAEEVLPRLQVWKNQSEFEPFVHAAQGVIEFRKNNFQTGRLHYANAVKAARESGSEIRAFLAQSYWIEEEVCLGTIGKQFAAGYVEAMDRTIRKDKDLRRGLFMVWNAMKSRISASIGNPHYTAIDSGQPTFDEEKSSNDILNLLMPTERAS